MRSFKSYCLDQDSLMWEVICVGADVEQLIQKVETSHPGTLDVEMLTEELTPSQKWGMGGAAVGGYLGGLPGMAIGGAAGAAVPWAWNKLKGYWNQYQQGGEQGEPDKPTPTEATNLPQLLKVMKVATKYVSDALNEKGWTNDFKKNIDDINQQIVELERKIETKSKEHGYALGKMPIKGL